MIEPHFFEIPIYRCDIDTHTSEMEAMKKKYVNPDWEETAPESYQNMIYYFERDKWYPWRYNEVIGWICLYIFGNQVRGDLWFEDSKRIGKGVRKKKFIYYGKAFEVSIYKDWTSEQIFNKIIDQLEALKRSDTTFKKRHIDVKAFKIIGEFVDWKALVDELNSFKYPRK